MIFDVRTPEEYRRFCIPGGVNVPGGDLILWAEALRRKPETPVVVNCAGRTRSIIGTAALLRLGINNVRALKNGTMGWVLTGLELESTPARVTPTAPDESRKHAREIALRIAEEERLAAGFRPRTARSPPEMTVASHTLSMCDPKVSTRRAYPGVAQYSRRAGRATRGRLRRREKQPDHLCQSSVVARSHGRLLVPANGLSTCQCFTRGPSLARERRCSRIRRSQNEPLGFETAKKQCPHACT